MLQTIKNSMSVVLAGVVISGLLAATFVLAEPTVSRAVSDSFVVTQTILSEIAFVASTTDVTMDASIGGLTGGTANGTTTVAVNTNNTAGYNMTLYFDDTPAMNQNGGTGYIDNYSPTTPGTPDFTFNDTAEVFSQFGYRVTGAQAADVDPTFQDNGVDTCGTGSSNTYGACWYNPTASTSPETIINRSTPTPVGGSTTTLNFRIYVPTNPNPQVPSGTYTATATLTAVVN